MVYSVANDNNIKVLPKSLDSLQYLRHLYV